MSSLPPLAVDTLAFRQALSQFAAGVTVVTTRGADGRPLGLTVTAFCSVSLEPPLVLVSIDNRSEAHDGFAAGAFAVSVLAEGQEEVSRRFATPGPSKFEASACATGTSGLPLIPDALAHLECRVASTVPAGDHTLYLGLVEEAHIRAGRPLLYFGRGYRRLAEEPEP
jgi:flavin reductase (DIM6/NTAB) family NADH-FMN oxidoreductase RutF